MFKMFEWSRESMSVKMEETNVAGKFMVRKATGATVLLEIFVNHLTIVINNFSNQSDEFWSLI